MAEGSYKKGSYEKEYQTVLLTGLPPSWFQLSDTVQRDALPTLGVNVLEKMGRCAEKGSALFKITSDPKRQDFENTNVTPIYKESTTFTITLDNPAEHAGILREIAPLYHLQFSNPSDNKGNVFKVTGHLDSIVEFRKEFNKRILDDFVPTNLASAGRLSTSLSSISPEEGESSTSSKTMFSEATPPKATPHQDHFPASSYDAYPGLNPDILSIMEKSSHIDGLHYLSSEGVVYIKKDSHNKDGIISKFQATYQDITSGKGGKKLKMDSLEVPREFSPAEIEEILGNFNTQFSQTCFSFNKHAHSVKIVSISSRQFESCVRSLKGRFRAPHFLSLPISEGRYLTLKKADIVEESVDVIVNAANGELKHYGGVALAIDKASGGQVQILSDEVMRRQSYREIAVGKVVSTRGGGGKLKCKYIIHAVGPSKNYHDPKKALVDLAHNILKEAEKLGAESIAIPAISSGIYAVDKDLVAHCIIDSILNFGYSRRTPALNDIRVVIIDQPTHQCFANYLQKERNSSSVDLVKRNSPDKNEIGGSVKHDETKHRDIDEKNESQEVTTATSNAVSDTASDRTVFHANVSTFYQRSVSDPSGIYKGERVWESSKSVNVDPNQWSSPELAGKEKTDPLPRAAISPPSSPPVLGSTGKEKTDPLASAGVPSSPPPGYNKDKPTEWCQTCLADLIPLTLTCGHVVCNQCFSNSIRMGNWKCPGCGTDYKPDTQTAQPEKPDVCPACSKNCKELVKVECGHAYCKKCVKSFKKNAIECPLCKVRVSPEPSLTPDKQGCCICLDILKDPVKTPCCSHEFCRNCLDKCMKSNPQCPVCKTVLGTPRGNQPPGGTMNYQLLQSSLPGYRECGTIVINYFIPDGKQGPHHPNPGRKYRGTTRCAYLPHNAEGVEIYKLLERAFHAGLIFTVGTSHTSGQSDVVVWNDIHHKTSQSSGTFGYPDPGYFKRVREELAAKGIVSAKYI